MSPHLKSGTPSVTEKMAAMIKWLLYKTNLAQHQIAAIFGINQGRVSEIKTGKRYNSVNPIDPSDFGVSY